MLLGYLRRPARRCGVPGYRHADAAHSRGSARAYYFAYFWLILPLLGLIETPRPLPATIATSVTGSRCRAVNAAAE